MRVNVKINQFSCPCRCDQIVRLDWSLREAGCRAVSVGNVSKILNTCWTGFLSRHGNNVYGLFLSSGRWIVLAFVTWFFASVLMWRFATFTRWIHPWSREKLAWTKTLHKKIQFGHCRGWNNFLNLLTFIVNHTPIWHPILGWSLTLFCQEHCHASLRYFRLRHQEIQVFSMVLWVAITEVSLVVTWSVSPICWET